MRITIIYDGIWGAYLVVKCLLTADDKYGACIR